MDVPVKYRAMNIANASVSPYGVHTTDNATTAFYCRYLMKRAMSAIKLTLPDSWAENYVALTLFCYGFGAVVDVPRYGAIFQAGSFYGRNVFYQPTRFMTATPLFMAPPNGWVVG